MSMVERRADVTWDGALAHGQGRLTVGKGAVDALPSTWASRTERANGQTSPEALIAAAQAGCYAMALSHTLAQGGRAPTRPDVTATCTLEQADGGFKISTIAVTLHGRLPSLDQPGFDTAARQAEQGCPVSSALCHNVEMRLHATLGAEQCHPGAVCVGLPTIASPDHVRRLRAAQARRRQPSDHAPGRSVTASGHLSCLWQSAQRRKAIVLNVKPELVGTRASDDAGSRSR